MVKIFSFFTKTGKIEVPIKDTDTVKATSIAKNPIMDLADKLREINDLSSKLTKAQVAETLAKGIEKVEFTDVDGSKQTLLKGGPGSGRNPEGGSKETLASQYTREGRTQESASRNTPYTVIKPEGDSTVKGKKSFNVQRNIGQAKYVVNHHDGVKTHSDGSKFYDVSIFHNKPELENFTQDLKSRDYTDEQEFASDTNKKYSTVTGKDKVEKLGDGKANLDALRDMQGKLQKGGPGSGRHSEGGTTMSEEVDSKFKEGAQQAKESRDSEAERYAPKDSKNKWEAKTPKNPEPEKPETVKPEGTDDKKIAMEHAKVNIPLKHQGSAKAYINSDQFHDDTARHATNRQKEIQSLGYAQGPHPAVRALNEHMHPMMTKAEFEEYADLTKIGWTDEAREAASQAREKGNGGNRVNSENVGGLVDRKEPFATSNGQMYGKNEPNGNYAVHSYGRHYPMYVHDGTNWHGNSDKFSVTTSKQMNQAKPTGAIKYHNTEDMKNIRDSFYNRPATKKNIDDLRNLAGKITKGGPGSGRHPEGGVKPEIDDPYVSRAHVGSDVPMHQSTADAVDAQNKPYEGKKYNFHSDPGHGWLAVPKQDLKDMNIHDKISGYSYMKGNTAYLEEDSDATTFHDAMKQKTGNPNLKFTDYINEKNSSNNQSPIRSYQSYDHTK